VTEFVIEPGAPPRLSCGVFVLRPFQRGDAAAWYSYLADPSVTEHTSWPAVSPEFIERVVERIISEYTTGVSLRWALAEAGDDRLIGACGYNVWSGAERRAELAYDLAPSYWGRGIMRNAVNTVVGWALNSVGLHRVEALVMTTNQRSIALLERCGFQREALLPGHRMARGVPRDFFLYSAGAPWHTACSPVGGT